MLQVNNISFSYSDTPTIKDLSFSAKKGENIAIIGESGSGKSTLLKLLYGEYDLDSGQLFWDHTEILGPKYNLVIGYDFIKYVSQEFDLMPYTSAAENVGKFLSNFFPEEKKERIEELLEVVQLSDFKDKKVKLLSGGQKQRIALARAIAKEPEIILLDEPFSNIDNFKKQSLRRNLFNYLKKKNITCIMASHDKEDVMGYSDKIIVINSGKIIASGSVEKLYKSPKHDLIASFFGEFNSIDGKIVYSHQLKIVEKSNLKVIVKQCYFKGEYYLIEVDLNGETVFLQHYSKLNIGIELFIKVF